MQKIQINDNFKAVASIKVSSDANFLHTYMYGGVVRFLSLEDIKGEFEDFDMVDDYAEIEKLRVGQSWCPDGQNIYIRISK